MTITVKLIGEDNVISSCLIDGKLHDICLSRTRRAEHFGLKYEGRYLVSDEKMEGAKCLYLTPIMYCSVFTYYTKNRHKTTTAHKWLPLCKESLHDLFGTYPDRIYYKPINDPQ